MPKKVFVTGCFDLQHRGHLAFPSGAGGGGYLNVVSENPVDGALRIRIHRPDSAF